jgi:CubicO group peptidase (beta-lactamase class C family)
MRVSMILIVVVSVLPVVAMGEERRPDFAAADKLIEAAIERKEIPGAVLLVGRKAGVVYEKAYGNRAVQPSVEPMTADTIFDIASLTKSVATTPAVMILVDRGKIDPAEKVAKYLPAFGNHGKEAITVEQLLLHSGGLIPDNAIEDYKDGPAKAWERINELGVISKPGEKFKYSDVSFQVLGKLVETIDGRSLDKFTAEEVFKPLGMAETAYLPPAEWRPRCAPTQQRGDHWMRGEVHDPRAFALGGVAGHAGVFSTARDLGRFCQMLLSGGELDGKRVLSKRAVELMSTGQKIPDGAVRSYGFDVKTAFSSPAGDRFPPLKSFGHTGFTGTCFWIDPADEVYYVLLTNSVHPDGKGKTVALRRAVSTAVAKAMLD